ncbi:hypothetical protein LOC72_01480 [Roseiconus lacunae]|nr:hypothetical protein [Roseiconus lacunae]
MVSDAKKHAGWVRELYVRYVFPQSKISDLLRTQSRIIEQRNSEITDWLMIDLYADIELPSKSIKWPSIEDAVIDAAIDREVNQVLDGVGVATGKQLTAFFSGLAGGEIARQATREAMKDKNGNVDLVGELFSWVVDAGVSLFVDEVVNEVAQTESTLRKEIDNSVDSLVQNLLGKESRAFDAVLGEWASIHHCHQNSVIHGICKNLGVDVAWARTVYQAHNQTEER